jgi:hypothetical protein
MFFQFAQAFPNQGKSGCTTKGFPGVMIGSESVEKHIHIYIYTYICTLPSSWNQTLERLWWVWQLPRTDARAFSHMRRAWEHLAKPEKLGGEEGTGGVQDSMGARAFAWRKSFKDVQSLEV